MAPARLRAPHGGPGKKSKQERKQANKHEPKHTQHALSLWAHGRRRRRRRAPHSTGPGRCEPDAPPLQLQPDATASARLELRARASELDLRPAGAVHAVEPRAPAPRDGVAAVHALRAAVHEVAVAPDSGLLLPCGPRRFALVGALALDPTGGGLAGGCTFPALVLMHSPWLEPRAPAQLPQDVEVGRDDQGMAAGVHRRPAPPAPRGGVGFVGSPGGDGGPVLAAPRPRVAHLLAKPLAQDPEGPQDQGRTVEARAAAVADGGAPQTADLDRRLRHGVAAVVVHLQGVGKPLRDRVQMPAKAALRRDRGVVAECGELRQRHVPEPHGAPRHLF
mmetsp:Transcript_10749/g.34008  ORF Transcript_10749/g.34008 Transcript_10749/m.34008 type:complete len:334 (-) Transcript_10749:1232-2233(-)